MVANSVSTTCGTCQPTGGYLATQNWNIISSNWTDLDVIAEFESEFGPQITQMDGFRRYTAAKTGNASTVFVMSVFDTIGHSIAAQVAAEWFVDMGNLNGVVSPNRFSQDDITAYYNIKDCVSTSSVGLYLATRFNTHSTPVLFTPENQTADLMGANEMFANITGYHSFLASEGINQSFYFNEYDTEEGALIANAKLMSLNAQENNVMGQIYPTAGEIKFDYLCAAGNVPSQWNNNSYVPTEDYGPNVYDDGASSSSTALLGTCLYDVIAVLLTSILFLFK